MSTPLTFRPRHIAVFRALYLGDLLCAVPALRSLRQRFPEAMITLIGLPWASAFVARTPFVDHLMSFPGHPNLPEVTVEAEDLARYREQVRRARFDLAVQMHGDGTVSNDVIAALGARYSIGYGPDGDDRLDQVLQWRPDDHEIDRWLRITGALGGETTDRRLEFALNPEDDRAALRLLKALPIGPGPVVGLHPGAKDGARRWPTDRFARLGDELVERFGARLVITGAEGERSLAQEIAQRMKSTHLDLTGRTDLGAFAGIIRRLELLVTNDTGASHVAAAMHTPSVVLFRPTRPEQWAPLDRTLHVIVKSDGPLKRLPVSTVADVCAEALVRRTTPLSERIPEDDRSDVTGEVAAWAV
jgi:ADP-heptose:LPS heptosyltransferase